MIEYDDRDIEAAIESSLSGVDDVDYFDMENAFQEAIKNE
jgi:hypothetical protein